MLYKKCLTAKQRLNAVLISDENETTSVMVVQSNNKFSVHETHNTIIPSLKLGYSQEFIDKFEEFDIQPFVDYYNGFLIKKEEKRLKMIEDERIAEEKRISYLKERILSCNTPLELAEEFDITIIDTASHWSDLYNGKSNNAFIFGDLQQIEAVELAIELHDMEGEFGEFRRRDGAQHSTFNEYRDLQDYQDALKRHFNGDNFWYRSQETEKETYCDRIKEAAEETDMNKILALTSDYQELESGYYDCNRNLEISELELESIDLMGYRYDVYSYSFGFKLNDVSSFKKTEDENE